MFPGAFQFTVYGPGYDIPGSQGTQRVIYDFPAGAVTQYGAKTAQGFGNEKRAARG